MKTKTIAWKNLPARAPIPTTAVWWLLLDRFHAAQWVWGSTGVLLCLAWLSFIIMAFKSKEVDIFEEPTPDDLKRIDILAKYRADKLAEEMGKRVQ